MQFIKHNCLLVIMSALAGATWLAYQRSWLIWRSPFQPILVNASHNSKSKKTVNLFFWHHQAWRHEPTEIIWTSQIDANLFNLVQAWLSLLSDEQILPFKIQLQVAPISANQQTAYLSFDRPLLGSLVSTHQKLYLIEGLLKSVRSSQLPIQRIQFLINHQPMRDAQLDFSQPWPVTGFLEN